MKDATTPTGNKEGHAIRKKGALMPKEHTRAPGDTLGKNRCSQPRPSAPLTGILSISNGICRPSVTLPKGAGWIISRASTSTVKWLGLAEARGLFESIGRGKATDEDNGSWGAGR